MAEPTPTRVPLTPAQIEIVEQMIADRQARVAEDVQSLIADALKPVQEALQAINTTLELMQDTLATAVTYGQPVALRAHAGKLMCAAEGGPTVEGEAFDLEARSSAGVWESFLIERGTVN